MPYTWKRNESRTNDVKQYETEMCENCKNVKRKKHCANHVKTNESCVKSCACYCITACKISTFEYANAEPVSPVWMCDFWGFSHLGQWSSFRLIQGTRQENIMGGTPAHQQCSRSVYWTGFGKWEDTREPENTGTGWTYTGTQPAPPLISIPTLRSLLGSVLCLRF